MQPSVEFLDVRFQFRAGTLHRDAGCDVVDRQAPHRAGGHTQFGSFKAKPGASLWVALSGPLSNFVLAGLGWLVMESPASLLFLGLLSDEELSERAGPLLKSGYGSSLLSLLDG